MHEAAACDPPNDVRARPGERPHPGAETLHRFAWCQTDPAENRVVVAHLLRGCPACAATLRRAIQPEISADAYDAALSRWLPLLVARSRGKGAVPVLDDSRKPAACWRG